MKKKILALLLACCMVIGLLSACGSKDNKPSGDQPSSPSSSGDQTPASDPNAEPEKVNLTVWTPSEDQNPDLGAWVVTMCDKFNEEHPEWDITFDYGVCSESDAKKLVTQDVDKAADVFLFGSTGLETLCQANALTEWGGTYKQFVEDNYPESLVDTLNFDGGLYGVPITTDTYFMYYDKSVFSEDDAKSLDTMLEKGKVAFPLANGYYLAAFYLANGCTFFGPNGQDRAAGIDLGGDKAVAVTNLLVDLVANPNFIVAEPSDAIGMMREGNCDAYVCGTWQATQTQEVLGENYGVAPLPSVMIDGVNSQIRPFTSAKAVGVKSTTKYPEVSLNLAMYLAGYEGQKLHYELRGYVPCENQLVTEVKDDPTCRADSETVSGIAVARGSFTEMSFYWTPAESMGVELRDGGVTHDNAAEKTEAFNAAANTSGVG
ncbi:MAG: extracellular solute-binding protein [Oscillospiraceae bacterium]|nr:extracellular solute-binding protein [Oscillospiraceae bacterium]